jgi:hypothetical protein
MTLCRSARLSLASIFAGAASLALATPALADPPTNPHVYAASFAGTGTNALSGPTDVAVDNSPGPSAGDVYVTDPGNHRVEKFGPAGEFILMFGKAVNKTRVEEPGSTEAEQNVCTAASSDTCQAGTSGSSPGALTTPRFLTVDNSPGGEGDVYVGDTGDNLVSKFDSHGSFISSNDGSSSGAFFGSLDGIATDPAGNLWVAGQGADGEFGPSGAFIAPWNTPFTVTADGLAVDSGDHLYISPQGHCVRKVNAMSFEFGVVDPACAETGLTMDPSDDNLYVDEGGTAVHRFSANCQPPNPTLALMEFAPCTPIESFGAGHLTAATGLAANATSGTVYVADTGAGAVVVFTVVVPKVATGPVTEAGMTTATISGHVDPAGRGNVTDCHFDYGTTAAYELGSVPCSPPTSPASPLTAPTEVTANLTGLQPPTVYHYRLDATNVSGTNLGQDRTFQLPPLLPAVDGASASGLTRTSATLAAQINPGFGPTSYRFEYGTATSYGFSTPSSESLGNDGVDHQVSTVVSGLIPGTTYHYRPVAINFAGTIHGPDQTFSTPDLPGITSTSASALTQTSATLAALLNPNYSPTTYHFEYGTAASYGSTTPESGPIGSGHLTHSVVAAVSGLAPATTYHYRVVATNGVGVTQGPDQTFTTTPAVAGGGGPPPPHCKPGFVNRNGRCVKRPKRHQKKHRQRSRTHG